MKLTFGVILSLWTCLALAEPIEEARENAFINVNMTLELDGIEGAIQDTRQSLDQVGVALNSIAQSCNLND